MTIVFYVGYYATPWGPEDLDNTGLGGTEKCVCFLAKELSAAGHDVHAARPGRPLGCRSSPRAPLRCGACSALADRLADRGLAAGHWGRLSDRTVATPVRKTCP